MAADLYKMQDDQRFPEIRIDKLEFSMLSTHPIIIAILPKSVQALSKFRRKLADPAFSLHHRINESFERLVFLRTRAENPVFHNDKCDNAPLCYPLHQQ